jgi:cytochrome b involved in lipid metabolism
MAVKARMREIDARRESWSQPVKEYMTKPLHSACGACTSCSDTCGDSSCLECDRKITNMESVSTTSGGSDSVHYFTMCEIKRHQTKDSAWLVVGDDVYDATTYVNQHPGGETSILNKAGGACDCTQDFHFHSKRGRAVWKKYHVGKVKRCPGHDGRALNDRQWWMFWM